MLLIRYEAPTGEKRHTRLGTEETGRERSHSIAAENWLIASMRSMLGANTANLTRRGRIGERD